MLEYVSLWVCECVCVSVCVCVFICVCVKGSYIVCLFVTK